MTKIAVIDLDSVAYSIGNGNKVLDEDGKPVKVLSKSGNLVFVYIDKTEQELIESADLYMNQLLKEGGFTHYIAYIKGAFTTQDRLKVNPDYKGNRSKEQPSWWSPVRDILISRWKAVEVDLLEVDDAVNITRLQLKDSYIVAIDGDLLGLEGTHYNWRTNEWITVNKDQAEYKFWRDMVVGQPGDNIKGLPGKGDKYWDKRYPFGCTALRQSIFTDYTLLLGEYEGVKEFYKNYISLYILKEKSNFVVPEPIEVQSIKYAI